MRKTRHISLLVIVLIVLFGSLALPGLASEPKIPLPLDKLTLSIEASAQITYTMLATTYVYLPIIVVSPNDLEIINLSYSGRDEYLEIENNGPGTQSMDGWQIVSVRGPQTYDFPNGITLGKGETLRVHSGPDAIDNPPNNLLWTTAYIWNNEGDKAELKDAQGVVRDTSCYGNGCP